MIEELAGFLLARIAEDEAVADKVYQSVAFTADDGIRSVGFEPLKERVLAECEVKRRIIEREQFVTSHGPAVDHVRALDMTTGATAALHDVLRCLALPYADHPDYRPEWSQGIGGIRLPTPRG